MTPPTPRDIHIAIARSGYATFCTFTRFKSGGMHRGPIRPINNTIAARQISFWRWHHTATRDRLCASPQPHLKKHYLESYRVPPSEDAAPSAAVGAVSVAGAAAAGAGSAAAAGAAGAGSLVAGAAAAGSLGAGAAALGTSIGLSGSFKPPASVASAGLFSADSGAFPPHPLSTATSNNAQTKLAIRKNMA